MNDPAAGHLNPFSALRHPEFARFAAGSMLCGVAQFLGGLATPFLVNQLTDSNSWVGAASFAALIPAVVGTPLSGTLAVLMERRLLLLPGLGLQTAVMAVVLVLYTGGRDRPVPSPKARRRRCIVHCTATAYGLDAHLLRSAIPIRI